MGPLKNNANNNTKKTRKTRNWAVASKCDTQWSIKVKKYPEANLTLMWPRSTGALWRSQARWPCRSPRASSRCSPTTPPRLCSPSSWRTPAGWSRSCPTNSFCTGERGKQRRAWGAASDLRRHLVRAAAEWKRDGEPVIREKRWRECALRQHEEIQLLIWHEAIIKLSGKYFPPVVSQPHSQQLMSLRRHFTLYRSGKQQTSFNRCFVLCTLSHLTSLARVRCVKRVASVTPPPRTPQTVWCNLLGGKMGGKKKNNIFCFYASCSGSSQLSTKTALPG